MSRRFTILHAMILIAAAAFGFALVRWNAEKRDELRRMSGSLVVVGAVMRNPRSRPGTVIHYLRTAAEWSGMVALPVGLAVFLLGLTASQTPLNTRITRPGLAASTAAALAWALGRVERWFAFVLRMLTSSTSPIELPSPPFRPSFVPYALEPPPVLDYGEVWFEFSAYGELRQIGLAVMVVWVILALSKRWSPEPSWRDRAGRALGFFWIGCSTLFGFADTLERYLI